MRNINNSLFISVIMNCHNGEKYLHEAVSSIIKQTYKNWELIFWDNQSKDSSKKIVKSFDDKRIKYYYARKFTNLHKARNLAIKKTKGDYIAFLDTDDYWIPTKLEIQSKKIKKSKCSLLYSNCFLINEKTFIKKKKITNRKLPSGFIINELLNHYIISLSTILIQKKLLINKKIFFNEKYRIIGDLDLVMRIALTEKIECIQSALSVYRIHPKNYSGKNIITEIRELKNWHNDFKKRYLKKYDLDKKAFEALKKKIIIREKLAMLSGIKKKIFVFKNLFLNFNRFNLMILIKELLPNIIKERLVFFNW